MCNQSHGKWDATLRDDKSEADKRIEFTKINDIMYKNNPHEHTKASFFIYSRVRTKKLNFTVLKSSFDNILYGTRKLSWSEYTK